jgi:hypothetical protein
VVTRQLAPLTRVRVASGSGCQAAHPDAAFFQSNGLGPAEQNHNFCFEGFCRCLNPAASLFKEVIQHCNNFINSQLVKGFSEAAGYMAAFCRTCVIQIWIFPAGKCGARLLFWKNEKPIINIVV